MTMAIKTKRIQWRIAGAILFGLSFLLALYAQQQQDSIDITAGTNVKDLSQVLGRPTDRSIALNLLAPNDLESYVEYGTKAGSYNGKTETAQSKAGQPVEIAIDKLKANTQYFYRLRYRQPGEATYMAAPEYAFHTQRPPGSPFVFDVQSDSHPERVNRMFQAELYARTVANVRQDKPDFYITMGDDFGVE